MGYKSVNCFWKEVSIFEKFIIYIFIYWTVFGKLLEHISMPNLHLSILDGKVTFKKYSNAEKALNYGFVQKKKKKEPWKTQNNALKKQAAYAHYSGW